MSLDPTAPKVAPEKPPSTPYCINKGCNGMMKVKDSDDPGLWYCLSCNACLGRPTENIRPIDIDDLFGYTSDTALPRNTSIPLSIEIPFVPAAGTLTVNIPDPD